MLRHFWLHCTDGVSLKVSDGEQAFAYLQFGSHRSEPPFQFDINAFPGRLSSASPQSPEHTLWFTALKLKSHFCRDSIQSLQHVTENLELSDSVSDLGDGWQRYGQDFPRVLPLSHTESLSQVQQFSFTATRRLVGGRLTQQRPVAPRYRPGSPVMRPLSPVSSGGQSF